MIDVRFLRENLDYVVARREQIPSTMIAGSKVADIDLHLHYVPDRYILSPNDGNRELWGTSR